MKLNELLAFEVGGLFIFVVFDSVLSLAFDLSGLFLYYYSMGVLKLIFSSKGFNYVQCCNNSLKRL